MDIGKRGIVGVGVGHTSGQFEAHRRLPLVRVWYRSIVS